MIRHFQKTLYICFLILLVFKNNTLYAQLEAVEQYYSQLEKDSRHDSQTIGFIQKEQGLVKDYEKLSQIILMRHGEPALQKDGARKRKEAIQFVRAYDSVGVYPPDFIPVVLGANEVQVIYTSNIPRSVSTARQVFNREELQKPDSLFREFERKIFAFPNIKLPLKWWLTGSRIFWFMGFNKKGIESFSEAKARARKASALLEADASENGKTLLVSHGLLNHFLVTYLKKSGWKEVFDGGKGYLSQKVLVKYED